MKYFVVGAKGQLGMELVRLLSERGEQYVAFGSNELDVTDRERVFDLIQVEKPDVILDAAAYTAVDEAEDKGKERNWAVNAEGTKNLAMAAAAHNATVVYVSTDYVFNGENSAPYLESDAVNPQNEYGKAKLAGELAVQQSGANYYIVRTSWVFGEFGNNFVYTMQKLGEKMDEISVVNDQMGRPTWTRTLAEFMMHLIFSKSEIGIYNLSNDGVATWYEFAREILHNQNVVVNPVSSDKFPTKARRPKNSILDLTKAKSTGFKILPWKTALQESGINHLK